LLYNAAYPGFEPRLTDSESVVLPVTPIGIAARLSLVRTVFAVSCLAMKYPYRDSNPDLDLRRIVFLSFEL
jgi:hypothetical protein